MPIHFQIQRTGNDFYCTADAGPRFYVGRRVPYEGNIGLYNVFGGSPLQKLNFAATDFVATHGFWAEFIEPTALCEGRNFLTLNTYDRAAFTFGFAQFAAHVPNGDFVRYFRQLLGLADAKTYFPNLDLIGGRITQTDSGRVLEDDATTAPLMAYLNPDLHEVQDAEVIAAARFIHFTANSAAARDAQVGVMAHTFEGFIKTAHKRLGINGVTADCCCVIADILHHGRGGKMTWPVIQDALRSKNPFAELIAIGAPKWNERKQTLSKAIKARPKFATLRWDAASGAFV